MVKELGKQYEGINTTITVKENISSLLSSNTFTVTTAHQNNIFTGPLYFIYKIVHAIKLADQLKTALPEHHFVPVYYIGSEDADLAELNHIYLNTEKIVWDTKQTGAVGRMKIDKSFLKLIDRLQGELTVLPFGEEIINKVKNYYKEGVTVEQATFQFVNDLFGEYGLVILLPDNEALKAEMILIFKDDLIHETASRVVQETAERINEAGYKIQAHPRAINLFYLRDDARERIERVGKDWTIVNTEIKFTEEEILSELENHPARFSPNVILRGIYQETILPNIAFIGGGGETAYWLQLKGLFKKYKVPFPMLVLRNSFLLVEKKWKEKIAQLDFTTEDFFEPAQELLKRIVNRESKNPTKLNGSLTDFENIYELLKKQAAAVDITLEKHVDALKSKAVYRLVQLEKKMLRAEKRKFSNQQRAIETIKNALFPGDGLQERRENLLYYYSKWGKDFIRQLYEKSPALEQEFVILSEL